MEHTFPHLPAGCAIQFDRISKGYVLENIKANLKNLAAQVPERLQNFPSETCQACQASKRTAHPDGMAAELSHARGDV